MVVTATTADFMHAYTAVNNSGLIFLPDFFLFYERWGVCEGSGSPGCLCCSMLFCHVLCGDRDLQFAEIPGMAENFHISFCGYSDFRYSASDVFFPGYPSGIVYECIGAYDAALYDGDP